MVSLGHGELTQQQIHLSACILWMSIFYVCICVLHVCMRISFRLKITSMCLHTNRSKITMYTTNAMGGSGPAVLSGDLNTRSSYGRAIELKCFFLLGPGYLSRFMSRHSVCWRLGTSDAKLQILVAPDEGILPHLASNSLPRACTIKSNNKQRVCISPGLRVFQIS